MIAYHGRQELKDAVLKGIIAHQLADKLVQGFGYWGRNGKACAVGCTLESLRQAEGLTDIRHDKHKLYEQYLGVPEALARIEDGIFEQLAPDLAQQWPARFARAIRPGADLSMVVPKFIYWLLTRPDGGVAAGIKQRPAIGPSILAVAALYQRWIDGAKPSVTEWREARDAADAASAAAYAAADAADADAAAAAAAADAAYAADAADAADAAYAADAAAAYAADAASAAAYAADAAAAYAADAASAAAYAAARRKERASQADYLISLLESC